jgi:hypothetical protein
LRRPAALPARRLRAGRGIHHERQNETVHPPRGVCRNNRYCDLQLREPWRDAQTDPLPFWNNGAVKNPPGSSRSRTGRRFFRLKNEERK